MSNQAGRRQRYAELHLQKAMGAIWALLVTTITINDLDQCRKQGATQTNRLMVWHSQGRLCQCPELIRSICQQRGLDVILGKPWLEQVDAIHRYSSDTLEITGADCFFPTVLVVFSHSPIFWQPPPYPTYMP